MLVLNCIKKHHDYDEKNRHAILLGSHFVTSCSFFDLIMCLLPVCSVQILVEMRFFGRPVFLAVLVQLFGAHQDSDDRIFVLIF